MCLKHHVGAWRHFARKVLEFLPSQFTDGAFPRVCCSDETLQSHPSLSTTPNSWQYPLPSVFLLLFQTRVNFTARKILVVPIFVLLHGNDVSFSAAPSVRDSGCKAADNSCTKRCQRITSFSSLLLQACQLHPGELWRTEKGWVMSSFRGCLKSYSLHASALSSGRQQWWRWWWWCWWWSVKWSCKWWLGWCKLPKVFPAFRPWRVWSAPIWIQLVPFNLIEEEKKTCCNEGNSVAHY